MSFVSVDHVSMWFSPPRLGVASAIVEHLIQRAMKNDFKQTRSIIYAVQLCNQSFCKIWKNTTSSDFSPNWISAKTWIVIQKIQYTPGHVSINLLFWNLTFLLKYSFKTPQKSAAQRISCDYFDTIVNFKNPSLYQHAQHSKEWKFHLKQTKKCNLIL